MNADGALTPHEVAVLAGTPRSVVEKAIEQKVFAQSLSSRPFGSKSIRRLPLYAVALASTVQSLGRRLSVDDKKFIATRLAMLSPEALKAAEVEIASAVVIRVGPLTRSVVEGGERYIEARDRFIEQIDGVSGGRAVIQGTRITTSAVFGRLSSGDTIDDLIQDYGEIPREAFEAAFLYERTHPPVGRPSRGIVAA